ncbi:MAG: hypothetical protein WC554_10760 [Clostridia bacterium]|nr:hypothetical protein [Clostridia bacterium]MDD4502286.1 hypothetical protein [Clostridia bacterium]NLV33441.1 hypothetical protein [Clostridiaceae bacterium]HQM96555.1 hypothetical protein [Clostridia bacterium]HQO70513.1 hypothetical protein [Clostridia bacterium]
MENKYVFVDWSCVEPGYGTVWPYSKTPVISPYGIKIETHKPFLEEKPVLIPDKPWESSCINAYATFIKIENKVKVWYEVFSEASMDDMKSNLAYAESDDGVNFVKPDLHIMPFNNDYNNNLIKNVHGTCVLYDKHADISQRYKLIWVQYNREKPFFQGCSIHGAVSADGIHWNDIEKPLLNNPSDTQNILEYDEDTKQYLIYTRQCVDYPVPRRSVSLSKSSTFSDFDEPVMIMHNDPNDPPDWDYYTSGYHKWPGAKNAHIMLMDVYKRTSDTFDIHLLTSRDGIIWYRPMGQQPYIDRTSYKEKDLRLSSTKGIIDNEDGTWSFYVDANPNAHNIPPDIRIKQSGQYRRAVIREDGFTSVTADELGGFYTIKLDIQSDKLMINAHIPYGGWIKASIVDRNTCEEIPGFESDSCDKLDSNKIWQAVSWNGKSSLNDLKECSYRIRFEMFKSKIYAFSI